MSRFDRVICCFFSRLKRPYSCFSSHLCFLVIAVLLVFVLSVLFLMAVVSPPSCFSMQFSSRCIDSSTLSSILAIPLPRFFLYTYSLSTSSLGCNALCMVISFLFVWSICFISSLVHFRKAPEYLISCDILYILRQFIIQLCETISYFLQSIQAIARSFRQVLLLFRMCWSM